MRYSCMHIPTSKESVQENEALNFRLLHRAGYIRKSSAGVYTFLPLGARTLEKLQKRIAGALEEMSFFRLQTLSMQSMDELLALLAAGRLSYKELPIGTWYVKEQILNNIRPRLGLLHPKVFLSLQGFKLLREPEELALEADQQRKLWDDLAKVMGIQCLKVDILSAYDTGSKDHMLFWPYGSGEETVLKCTKCSRTTTPDSLACLPVEAAAVVTEHGLQMVHTPTVKTIQEVAAFLGVLSRDIVKTLIYKADGRLIAVLLRGDRELSEIKLKTLLKCELLTPATEEEVYQATGAEVGFAGPVGIKAGIICDYEVAAMQTMVVGANKTDYHYMNVCANRDFEALNVADVRCGTAEDQCPECGGSVERIDGFALARLHNRGAAHTLFHELTYQNSGGMTNPMYVLDFEFHLYRLLAAAIESGHDEAGISMPNSIAPFEIIVMPVHADNEEQMKAALSIYEKLKEQGFDVILDDREQRVSAKFKDSELIGIPLRITVGRKITEGIIEIKPRTGAMKEIQAAELMSYMAEREESST